MSIEQLQRAINVEMNDCVDSIDKIRSLATSETENEVYDLTRRLRIAIDLSHCLRRLVEGRSQQEVHKAFGAPGDFGYESPIGAALQKVYGC